MLSMARADRLRVPNTRICMHNFSARGGRWGLHLYVLYVLADAHTHRTTQPFVPCWARMARTPARALT